MYRFLICAGMVLSLAAGVAADPRMLEDQPTTLVYPPFWHTPLGVHRGTPELLRMFVGDRTLFSQPEGLACQRLLGKQGQPQDDAEFQISVVGANSGGRCLIYNPSLMHLDVLGDAKAHPDLFQKPMGVAMAADGTTWVTDPVGRQVVRCTFQNRLLPDSTLAPPPVGWLEPWGIALDSTGRIYISDAGHNQIFCYSPAGEFLYALGPSLPPDGLRLDGPKALAVVDTEEPWAFYHDDFLFVCDQQGQRLLRLNRHGQVQKIRLARDLAADPQPAGFNWMALDYYENVWVTDQQKNTLHKFDRNLEYLTSWGKAGSGDYVFDRPSGITIYRHFGQVFVAEAAAAQYFWIGADMLSPCAAWEPADPPIVRLEFKLTEPAWLTVTVQGDDQAKPLTLYKQHRMDSGLQTLRWSCPLALAGQGLRFDLVAEATYSSACHMAKRVRLTLPPKPE